MKQKSVYETVYLFSYSIFLLVMILNTSLYSVYVSKITFVTYALCVGVIFIAYYCKGKHSTGDVITVLLGLTAAVVVALTSKTMPIAASVIIIVTAKGVSYRDVFKTSLYVTVLAIMLVLIGLLTGAIENYVYTGDRTRYALGFRYVLVLPTYLFNISAIYIFLQKQRANNIVLLALFIINYVVYRLTVSRLTFISTAAIIVFAFVYKYLLHNKRMPKLFAGFIPIYAVCALFSIVMTIFYNESSGWQSKLNDYLGGRLLIGHRSMKLYSFSLFGNSDINWVGQGLSSTGEKIEGTVTYVDNLYFHILQKYGAVFFLIIIALLTVTMFKCFKANDVMLYFIMVVLALHGLIDPLIQNLNYNTFLFVMIYFIANKKVLVKPKDTEHELTDEDRKAVINALSSMRSRLVFMKHQTRQKARKGELANEQE